MGVSVRALGGAPLEARQRRGGRRAIDGRRSSLAPGEARRDPMNDLLGHEPEGKAEHDGVRDHVLQGHGPFLLGAAQTHQPCHLLDARFSRFCSRDSRGSGESPDGVAGLPDPVPWYPLGPGGETSCECSSCLMAVAVLLTGCVLDLRGTEWQKPGAMFQEVSAVEVQCARQAFEIGPGPDLILGGLLDVGRIAVHEVRQANAFSDCMKTAGYERSS